MQRKIAEAMASMLAAGGRAVSGTSVGSAQADGPGGSSDGVSKVGGGGGDGYRHLGNNEGTAVRYLRCFLRLCF